MTGVRQAQGMLGGSCNRRCKRKAPPASICGSYLALIVLRSYAKLITFRPSSDNRSLLYNLRGTKTKWRLLRIIMYGMIRTSLQERVRHTGLTYRTAFWLEGKTKCNALASLFPFSVEAEDRSLWSWTWIWTGKGNENHTVMHCHLHYKSPPPERHNCLPHWWKTLWKNTHRNFIQHKKIQRLNQIT